MTATAIRLINGGQDEEARELKEKHPVFYEIAIQRTFSALQMRALSAALDLIGEARTINPAILNGVLRQNDEVLKAVFGEHPIGFVIKLESHIGAHLPGKLPPREQQREEVRVLVAAALRSARLQG